MFASFASSAQKIEKYYDFNWHLCEPYKARYYTSIEYKKGLWEREDYYIHEKSLQMKGNYHDSACKVPEGIFYFFHPNTKLESTGKYVNGQKDSLWLSYYSNGMMKDSTFYTNGQPTGISMGWFYDGSQRDSVNYRLNGTSVHVTWFANGNPSSAGIMIGDTQQGPWTYFHQNGNLSAKEVYDHSKLISREYYDEDGKQMDDTSNHDRRTSFAAGEKAWAKYVLSKIYFPAGLKLVGGDQAYVVVGATIDEDGKITNPEIVSPFVPEFNEIALDMMKKAPKWLPAIDHNRKVKAEIRQPVTFAQSEY